MLKKLANNLPMINQCSHEQHLMTGAEILAWNTMTEIDGEKINPDKKYLFNSPVYMVQNNQRAMKRAFLRNGPDGIKNFLDNVLKTISQNN